MVNDLMTKFYASAIARGAVTDGYFRLSAKQFTWLCDVERRESGFVPTARTGRVITGVVGDRAFEAREQKYGSAIVRFQ